MTTFIFKYSTKQGYENTIKANEDFEKSMYYLMDEITNIIGRKLVVGFVPCKEVNVDIDEQNKLLNYLFDNCDIIEKATENNDIFHIKLKLNSFNKLNIKNETGEFKVCDIYII